MPPLPADGEPIDWPLDAVEVGRISGAWGIKGGIKVQPFSSDPQALFSSKRWFVAPAPDAASPRSGSPRLLRVIQAREQGDAVVATVQDISDRDSAQALNGWRVHVPRSSFPTPDSDEFYWIDLIGCRVQNLQGDDLGEVQTLIETGPSCVLQLSSLDLEGKPRMVPFVDAYVPKVDVKARLIVVDWALDY